MLKLSTPVLISLSLGAWLALTGIGQSHAQGKEDFQQPVQISSDNNSFDLQSNQAIYDQNVIIRQGSLKITADRLTAERDRERSVQYFVAAGAPATYEQQLDDGSPISAQADEIHYDQVAQTLTLRGSAELRQNDSVIRAATITYDFERQQLRTERAENDDGQVETIFMPRDDSKSSNGTELEAEDESES